MAGDLNLKKSWNPALVENQQKVWEEEQQKGHYVWANKAELEKYKQEQEYLELLKLQHGDQFQIKDLNKQQKLKISKLNWMYDDVPFEGNEKVEENSSGFIESNVEFTDGKSKVENLLKEKHRDLPMIEINVFQLNNYKLGSIGFTSRELENLKIDFIEEKLLSNDYNGDNPTNKIVYLKVLFENTIEKGGDLKDLVKCKVNPTDNEWNPDILNILALTALGKNQENSDDVEANNIENLVKNKEFLLDVREEYEYQEGHVKGAVNLPLREILSQKDSLPKDKDIYVYCRSGHRSADAVNFLKSLGFEKVHNIEGGFIDISFNEYHKDKGNLENSVVTNYNFD